MSLPPITSDWTLLVCKGCRAWQADIPEDDLDPCALCGSKEVERVEVVPRPELENLESNLTITKGYLNDRSATAARQRAALDSAQAEVERLRAEVEALASAETLPLGDVIVIHGDFPPEALEHLSQHLGYRTVIVLRGDETMESLSAEDMATCGWTKTEPADSLTADE